jgi:hypothetical protein
MSNGIVRKPPVSAFKRTASAGLGSGILFYRDSLVHDVILVRSGAFVKAPRAPFTLAFSMKRAIQAGGVARAATGGFYHRFCSIVRYEAGGDFPLINLA